MFRVLSVLAYTCALITISLWSPLALGQHQTLSCEDCRDIRDHPQDFGNYSFNETFGQLPKSQISPFMVYTSTAQVWNRQNQWAVVQVSTVQAGTGITVGIPPFSFEVPIATDWAQIDVQSQYGKTTSYEVLITTPPLSVGAKSASNNDPIPNSTTTNVPEKIDLYGNEPREVCCQLGPYYWYYEKPWWSVEVRME